MDNLPNLPLFKIAEELPIYDVLNLCKTNKRISKICKNELFWKKRAMNVLGYDINDLPDKVNKKWYIDHAGVAYHSLNGNDFEEIGNNVKKIFCVNNVLAFIDIDDNAFVYHHGKYQFVMDNVKQISQSTNNNKVLILNKDGILYQVTLNNIWKRRHWFKPSLKNRDKINFDFIEQEYFLSNGELYKMAFTYGTINKYINPLGNIPIKYVKSDENGFFIYISKNDDLPKGSTSLYFAYDPNNHLLVANDVKYGSITSDANTIHIFWIDKKNNLYMTFYNYRTKGGNKSKKSFKTIDEQLKKNNILVMKNILKICFSTGSTYILTKDHDVWVNKTPLSLDFSNIDNYEFVGGNVEDIESSKNNVMLLVLT